MQTKLGAKINILFDRVMEYWHGKPQDAVNVNTQQNSRVTVSQPLAGQHQPSQADYMDHSQILPTNMPMIPNVPTQHTQQKPDFNEMYHQQVTQMPGAATPGIETMGGMMEPLAANAALGGFTSW
jgi:hypothetical protein